MKQFIILRMNWLSFSLALIQNDQIYIFFIDAGSILQENLKNIFFSIKSGRMQWSLNRNVNKYPYPPKLMEIAKRTRYKKT